MFKIAEDFDESEEDGNNKMIHFMIIRLKIMLIYQSIAKNPFLSLTPI